MQELPQGRKSRIEILEDTGAIKKTYNSNGNPAEKFRKEVGFYRQYSYSRVIPKLIGAESETHITIERVIGERLADLLPLSRDKMELLSDEYTEKLVELFGRSTGIDRTVKQDYFDGIGAEEGLRLLHESLSRLCDQYDRHPITCDLLDSITRVEIDEELLIKLDWNPENVFLRDGKIHRFIDFEQAFIGTRAILVGILLHNPVWPAQQLFGSLKEAGLFQVSFSELRNYLCYSFATVLVDSIHRRGDIWQVERLETAFERHVTARYNDVVSAS